MIASADDIAEDAVLTADVCIIGAGPAGITVALDLIGSGLSVLVLESGRDDWDSETQALAKGEVAGRRMVFDGVDMALDMSRLRQLGGTSNHWTGMCRPLDASDFEERAWVPRSGWPISRVELDPYYAKAVASCELLADRFDADYWHEVTGLPLLAEGDMLRTVVFQFSPPTRFGPAARPALAAARDVDVHLGANVTAIDTDRSGGSVERVRVATLGGRTWSVEADRYVLAVGGIETPRLLLASDGVDPAGVGNANDLVGRCFMDHPHVTGGRVAFAGPDPAWAMYRMWGRTRPDGSSAIQWGGFSPTAAAQEAAGTGNACVLLWTPGTGPDRGGLDADSVALAAVEQLMAPVPSGPSNATLTIRTEQVPNPDSRVTLGEERDALGMRRAVVDWRLLDQDRDTLRNTLILVAEKLGATGAARVEVDPSGTPVEELPVEVGNHHMGTARMHADPAQGVVDADCRMHQVDNLYVCGSAVFATSGMANPTLTIVALAHRLADHLRR
jgi:choline dehydrogenase-like flavoprotein